MGALSGGEKMLCAVYGVLGLIGLIGTQVVLFGGYVTTDDGPFLDQLTANGVATFMLIDLLVVAIIGLVFMVVEGRRLGMRFLWVYVLLTFAVAISVALPLFLILRQVHLAKERAPVSVASPTGD
jgi:hypothetical protein